VLALAACSPAPVPEEGSRTTASLRGAATGWSVLLLSIDTLRADRLGAYGYDRHPTSPNLDRLLARGTLFELAMAPRASTWPSLGSVLTGLYPSGHGLVSNGYAFADGQTQLSAVLGGAGYRTGAFLSNMCSANHQGWEAFACGGGNDAKVTRRALEWARSLPSGEPFLLWIHYFGAHPPYYNGGDLAATTLDPGYDGALAPTKRSLDRVMTEGVELDQADRRHLDALYDAAVMGADGTARALLAGLEEMGRLEQTLIVVLADHGEDLYEHHGYLYHACSVYQSSLHVPLAFVAPGLVPEGGRVRATVELIDVLPTLLELLGQPLPAELDGVSLLPYLARPERGGGGRPAFSEYETTRIRTVLADGWKLVWNPDGIAPLCMPGAPPDLYPIEESELYDLRNDPAETGNLASRHPERVKELRELLERRFATIDSQGRRQEISDELEKELESLGYVTD
jgi:arylsulfatase A-like enzyme